MERNTDRKTLSFAGMTSVPSDLLCDDGELQESNGFISKNGEMKPIQRPKLIGNVQYKIKYVHKMADYKNIIAVNEQEKSIVCYKIEGGKVVSDGVQTFSIGETYDIKNIGNTLVCSTEYGLHYLLFKEGKYKDLGTELPKPNLEFSTFATNIWIGGGTACELKELIQSTSNEGIYAYYDSDGSFIGFSDDVDYTYKLVYWHRAIAEDSEKYEDFQSAVQGHIAARIKLLKEKNYFCFPFFVRYALRLFDGSYARISNPILICPTINRNCYFTPVKYDKDKKTYVESPLGDGLGGILPSNIFIWKPWFSKLYYKANIDSSGDWEDIIKEIVVFASDDVMPFNLDGEFEFKSPTVTNGTCYANQVSSKNFTPPLIFPELVTNTDLNHYFDFNYNSYTARDVIMPKNYKADDKIIEELMDKSQFYKIFTIDINENEFGYFKEASIKDNTVSNLTVQEQLKVDDYYGWTNIMAKYMFAYNSRINLFSIKRKPFSGFSHFTAIASGESASESFTEGALATTSSDVKEYEVYTHIISDSMSTWVKAEGSLAALPEMLKSWIYYPDPNATEMRIVKKGTTQGIIIKLKTHPMLNGAYYFGELPYPRISQDDFEYKEIEIPTVNEQSYETLDSQIFTSVVNNPFVFEASGDNTVGTGKILGIAANTEAISQGQFGQYPLFVFTDEGTYAMGVNSEGLYSTVYPVSREVCNNADSITQTDSLVYFTSEKGLMAISGGTVACMSEQMRGRIPRNFTTLGDGDFMNFLKGCKIAYDYRDSLLRIYTDKKTYLYLYNMSDKTFGMTDEGMAINSIVNDYPDNLIQDTDGNIYSLSQKPSINEDTDSAFDGTIITRPLKLGGSLNLKSLRAIKNLVDTNDGKISTEILGSNDCKYWQKLHSLTGKPWKYFTIKYSLKGFRAADSFVGSIIEIQSRRSDKMR